MNTRDLLLPILLLVGCSSSFQPTSSGAKDPDGGDDTAKDGDDTGDSETGDSDTADTAPEDPCPELTIPTTCFDRSVVYREWGPDAVGDGTYFVGQEPYRLGFTRVPGLVWLVKIRLDENTYLGRAGGYGDSDPGITWIADSPCDPSSALESPQPIANNLHGGGSIFFVVARDEKDAKILRTDPKYAGYGYYPVLQGGHCYYVGFENTDGSAPTSADWFTTVPDTCGRGKYSDCYYLAFDFVHYYTDPITGATMKGSVIPGLTR